MSVTVKAYGAPAADKPLCPMDIQRRACKPKDVKVDIKFCGICHSDLHQARNEWKSSSYPMVPGHEIVGIVSGIGSEVTKFKVGDKVGVGCYVDSCRTCNMCKKDLENYCANVGTFTYNSVEREGGAATQGGYSQVIVVDEAFTLKVADNLDLARAAPLLCAGITTYSPLRKWGCKAGTRVGVVGLGGLGHMAVKLAKAMGATVTVFTTSEGKIEAAKALGAQNVILSTKEDQMKSACKTIDLIIDTVGVPHDLDCYVQTLDVDGCLVLVGLPSAPNPPVNPFNLIWCRRSIGGSLIGGLAETQEMLDFCSKHNIMSDIEVIKADDINNAFERMLKNDIKYRFVIDTSSL